MSSFENLIQKLSIFQLGLNWVDGLIIAVFVFYILEGFQLGLLFSLFDLISFLLSFIFGLKFYNSIAALLITKASFTHGIANAVGFFIVAFLSEILISVFFKRAFYPLIKTFKVESPFLKRLNQILGIIPGFISAFILLAFFLALVTSFPLSPFLKHAISSSKIGNTILAKTQRFEGSLNNIFGGAVKDTLNFLTIEPQSDQTVKLHFTTTEVKIDSEAEKKMLEMVNKERTSKGLMPLVMDESLRKVAQSHSKDMFARGYFSHNTPEGLSPFDRMAMSNISFIYAGENLALSPNVEVAMQGLMQSPGHRENILSSNFRKVGIGVIDGGMYGEMFAQEFTN